MGEVGCGGGWRRERAKETNDVFDKSVKVGRDGWR